MSYLTALEFANYGFVLFFGVVASLYLADIPFRGNERFYVLSLLGFGTAQYLAYLLLGEAVLYKCYPLIIHLPLILVIHFISHKNIYISVIAVLSAYLLCTPRKWFGTLLSLFAGYDPVVADIAEVLITLPLLFITIKFISPYIIRLKYESKTTLLLFFLLPLSYYVLQYTFTVYTDLLHTAGAAVVEAIDSFTVLLYFVFSMLSLKLSSQKNKAEHTNMLLHAAAAQAQKEIAQLSCSERQAAIYRHDLRHHLNFVRSCIASGKLTEATAYIDEICDGIESSRLIRYCENETVNLILSSYAQRAATEQIPMQIKVTAADFTRFQIMDLCSLLANGLENAIHACMEMENKDLRFIQLSLYEKNHRLCINLANSYQKAPTFVNRIPVTRAKNHGVGTQSMISVVEKYKGVYGFSASNGTFHFQASM